MVVLGRRPLFHRKGVLLPFTRHVQQTIVLSHPRARTSTTTTTTTTTPTTGTTAAAWGAVVLAATRTGHLVKVSGAPPRAVVGSWYDDLDEAMPRRTCGVKHVATRRKQRRTEKTQKKKR
jgi:hypothetical protein